MKSIAGSIVVLGACHLIATAGSESFSRDDRPGAYVVGSILVILGLVVVFSRPRDPA